MFTVLIVDNDSGQRKSLARAVRKHRKIFRVDFAGSGREAVEILARKPVDLLVTGIVMPEMDGFQLLAHLKANYPAIPCIVQTAYNPPGLERELSRSVFRFFGSPVDAEKLAESILDGLQRRENNGVLDGVSVSSLMQIIEVEGKSCLLIFRCRDGKKQGAMFFKNGEPYDAVYGDLEGEPAALQIIAQDDLQMEYRQLPSRKIKRKIRQNVQSLILESMHLKDQDEIIARCHSDEAEKAEKNDSLEEGIKLLEGSHQGKAQRCFLRLVSRNKNDAMALLWLSRTLLIMQQISVTLGKAYKLAPRDQEVIHDAGMFESARRLNLQHVKRCPFCYAPIDEMALDCHFCGISFKFEAESFNRVQEKVDRSELQRALSRFERVLVREINWPLTFRAVLACLYLGDFDRALLYLELLRKFADITGAQENYQARMEQILTFIASRKDTVEAVESVEEAVEAVEESSDSRENESPDRRKKILVVEDSPTTRKVIKMTLQNHNYSVIEAGDGVEALARINDELPDLVMLDVMLPKLDGYSVLALLKQHNSAIKNIPVIMLTSKDGLRDRLKGKFSASKAYLTKPFNPEVLIETVRKFI